jgi:hypothetical protein
VGLGRARINFNQFDASDFMEIPSDMIPSGLGKHGSACAQELCYLAQVARSDVAETTLLSTRFRRADALAAYLYAGNGSSTERNSLTTKWIAARINDIESRNTDLSDDGSSTKPTTVLLEGPAGAGKTTRVTQMCDLLGIPHSEVYYRQHGNHWDGYTGQLITVFDDLFQGNCMSAVQEFVHVVNSASVPLPMATLSQKGTMFTSPIVIVTANEIVVPKGINSSAVARRMDHVYHCVNGKIRNAKLQCKGQKLSVKTSGTVKVTQLMRDFEEICFGEFLPSAVSIDDPADHEWDSCAELQVLSMGHNQRSATPLERQECVDPMSEVQFQSNSGFLDESESPEVFDFGSEDEIQALLDAESIYCSAYAAEARWNVRAEKYAALKGIWKDFPIAVQFLDTLLEKRIALSTLNSKGKCEFRFKQLKGRKFTITHAYSRLSQGDFDIKTVNVINYSVIESVDKDLSEYLKKVGLSTEKDH